jgi:hypothetical protein
MESNINVVGLLFPPFLLGFSCLTVENVLHDLVPGLDLTGGAAGDEVE